jgi:hypothetical protein
MHPSLTEIFQNGKRYNKYIEFLKHSFKADLQDQTPFSARVEYRIKGPSFAINWLKSAAGIKNILSLNRIRTSTLRSFKFNMVVLFDHIFTLARSFKLMHPSRIAFLNGIRSLLLSLTSSLVFIEKNNQRRNDYIKAIMANIEHWNWPYMDGLDIDFRVLRFTTKEDIILQKYYIGVDFEKAWGSAIPDMCSWKQELAVQQWYKIWMDNHNETRLRKLAHFLVLNLQEELIFLLPRIKDEEKKVYIYSKEWLILKYPGFKITANRYPGTLEDFRAWLFPYPADTKGYKRWNTMLHPYFFQHIHCVFNNQKSLIDFFTNELFKQLNTLPFLPFSNKSTWNIDYNKKEIRLIELTKIPVSAQVSFSDAKEKNDSIISIASQLLSQFISDLWTLKNNAIGLLLNVAGQPNYDEEIRSLQMEMDLDKLKNSLTKTFFKKCDLPVKYIHKGKSIKKIKSWQDRFNFFFPKNGFDKHLYLNKKNKYLFLQSGAAQSWSNLVATSDADINKVHDELWNIFITIECLPDYYGYQLSFRLNDNFIRIIENETIT